MIHLQKTTPEDIPWVMEMENHADNRAFVTQNSLDRHLAIITGADEEHFNITDARGKKIG